MVWPHPVLAVLLGVGVQSLPVHSVTEHWGWPHPVHTVPLGFWHPVTQLRHVHSDTWHHWPITYSVSTVTGLWGPVASSECSTTGFGVQLHTMSTVSLGVGVQL